MSVEESARRFVAAINQHDIEEIYQLMTDDHRFIDSGEGVINGREEMKKGWIGYFAMVPDYLITVTEVLVSGDTVVLLGKASGTYTSGGDLKPENHWETPAAWKAVVAGKRIRQWQVFADNEPIREVIRRESKQ